MEGDPDRQRDGGTFSEEKGRKSERISKSAAASPKHGSVDHLPFAEEGNLTIKQRPRIAVVSRPDTEIKTPPEGPVQIPNSLELPEFNLKESDTVKRRHKPKDKDASTPEEASTPNHSHTNILHTHDDVSSRSAEDTQRNVFQRIGSMGKGPKPPVSCKPSSPLRQAPNSRPTTPQKTVSSVQVGAQTAIPKLTSVQIHTVSPKLGGSIHVQTCIPSPKPAKHPQTVMSKPDSPQKAAGLFVTRLPQPGTASPSAGNNPPKPNV